MKLLVVIVFVAFLSGFVLEKQSEEFKFGIQTRYVEQCLTPIESIGAGIILISEGMKLYDIKADEILLGTTKEQREKLLLFTEAGYYWAYFNSCDSLKSHPVIQEFNQKIEQNQF